MAFYEKGNGYYAAYLKASVMFLCNHWSPSERFPIRILFAVSPRLYTGIIISLS
jgi:hypothetical protein